MTTEFIITMLVLIAGYCLFTGYLSLSSRIDRVLALLGRLETQDEPADRERRETVRQRIANANESEVVKYLSHAFGLSQEDPWVASVVKTKNRIGLDAAVTMILDREKEP